MAKQDFMTDSINAARCAVQWKNRAYEAKSGLLAAAGSWDVGGSARNPDFYKRFTTIRAS
jgi:hypothetical protein